MTGDTKHRKDDACIEWTDGKVGGEVLEREMNRE